MLLTVEGVTQSISDWAADYGIPVALIRSRLNRGWSNERAVLEPMVTRRGEKLKANDLLDLPPMPRPVVKAPSFGFAPQRHPAPPSARRIVKPRHKGFKAAAFYTWNGERMTVADWADRIGITRFAMYARLKNGVCEEAFRPCQARIKKKVINQD